MTPAAKPATTVRLRNAQREVALPLALMRRLARRAVQQLGICVPGTIEITFIRSAAMRKLNCRFKGHDRVTDVLSFRYVPGRGGRTGKQKASAGGPPGVIGEVLIAPSQASVYARENALDRTQELGRYVVHGLLHWLGHEDQTAPERALMRRREDRLLGGEAWMKRTQKRTYR